MSEYFIECPGCGKKIDIAIPKQKNTKAIAKQKTSKGKKIDANAWGWAIVFVIIGLLFLSFFSK